MKALEIIINVQRKRKSNISFLRNCPLGAIGFGRVGWGKATSMMEAKFEVRIWSELLVSRREFVHIIPLLTETTRSAMCSLHWKWEKR